MKCWNLEYKKHQIGFRPCQQYLQYGQYKAREMQSRHPTSAHHLQEAETNQKMKKIELGLCLFVILWVKNVKIGLDCE